MVRRRGSLRRLYTRLRAHLRATLIFAVFSVSLACGEGITAQGWADTAAAAAQHGVEPELLAALVWQESRYCAEAVSPAGAIGLGQLMPATALELGVDPWQPDENLEGAARYLRAQLDTFGRVELALAAYNAGPEAVRRYGGIPPYRETQAYVPAVLTFYEDFKRQRGVATSEPAEQVAESLPLLIYQTESVEGAQPEGDTLLIYSEGAVQPNPPTVDTPTSGGSFVVFQRTEQALEPEDSAGRE